jgi:Protein of unknown function (DUF3224)
MMTTLESRLHIDSWDEKPYRESEDGRKFSTAAVVLSAEGEVAGDVVTAATFESVLFYRADGTGQFVSVMQLDATLAGRSGSFALSGEGSFQDGAAHLTLSVIAGSGIGGLAGLTGSLESTSTHSDYPYMPVTLRYDFG